MDIKPPCGKHRCAMGGLIFTRSSKRGSLSRSIRSIFPFWPERIRDGFGQRAAAIALTLLLEGVLALLLLTLAPPITPHEEEAAVTVINLDTRPDSERAPDPPKRNAQDARAVKQLPPSELAPHQPIEPPPASLDPPWIELSREQMAAAEIGAISPRPAPPSAAPQPMMGPPDTRTSGDTQRVGGQGPGGEPLYAASWYRKPYDDELRGYLSTARGPGWGLIACRTVPDYRVADCVAVDEYPAGSNIARAVLAAAWQFRVRPPRIGGQLRIGEWVRIRIDYDVRPQ